MEMNGQLKGWMNNISYPIRGNETAGSECCARRTMRNGTCGVVCVCAVPCIFVCFGKFLGLIAKSGARCNSGSSPAWAWASRHCCTAASEDRSTLQTLQTQWKRHTGAKKRTSAQTRPGSPGDKTTARTMGRFVSYREQRQGSVHLSDNQIRANPVVH